MKRPVQNMYSWENHKNARAAFFIKVKTDNFRDGYIKVYTCKQKTFYKQGNVQETFSNLFDTGINLAMLKKTN